MNESSNVVEPTFRIHLIGMSGHQRKREVRLLLVATTGVSAVFEGRGSWSRCTYWIKHLPGLSISKPELILVKKIMERERYATLPEARASLPDLESLGLQRVDI
jgi:hypothetical protein